VFWRFRLKADILEAAALGEEDGVTNAAVGSPNAAHD
jgi:hypothetical protein